MVGVSHDLDSARVLRRLIALLVCAALAGAMVDSDGCGSIRQSDATSRSQSSTARTPETPDAGGAASRPSLSEKSRRRDTDGDDDTAASGYDPDNDKAMSYGEPADPVERQMLIGLVRRYYGLAAADDGAAACSLLYVPLQETTVEEHEPGVGPPSLRGRTCAQVASGEFALHHRELARQAGSLEPGEVDVKGNAGTVRVRFASVSEYLVLLHREHGIWKVDVLFEGLGV